MKLFLKDSIREIAGKGSLVKSNIIVAVCAVLIAVNIGVFIFLPKILSPLAIILSNAVTVILMFFAFQPMSHIMQTVLKKKEDEIYQRKKEEEELREKVSALENKTRELSSCLSTWGQIASAPMEMERVSEYIIGRPSFDNYVVKETPLAELLEDPRFKPKDPDGFMAKLGITLDKWKDWLFHSKDKTVLYIGRHRDKRSIGIKLDSIRIARDGDKIALYGANITVLDPIKLEPDTDSVSHCWVLNNDKGKTPSVSINTADIYSAIPELYAQRCREEAKAGFDKQFELQCQKKTETLRNLLSEYVPGVVFYDSIDDTSAPWVSLKDCFNDKTLYPILSSINLICDLLSDSGNNGR